MDVDGENVTRSSLEIQRLLNNTNYTFGVAALNNVSSHVREEDWGVATVNVYLLWNEAKVASTPGVVFSDSTKNGKPRGRFVYKIKKCTFN